MEYIIVLGSINFDVVSRADRLPEVGETVNGEAIEIFTGGKGSNQATQSALLGAKTYFAGQIGEDKMGGDVINALMGKGVDCRYLTTSKTHPTGCASIIIDPNGDNMLVHAPGANHHIPIRSVDTATATIEGATVFMTQNEINSDAKIRGLEIAHNAGVKTILNPAPAVDIPDDIFPLIDYITPNETEAEFYTGILRTDMDFESWKRQSTEFFIEKGVKNVCLTLGEKGSYFYNEEEEHTIPAFSVNVVDTTAAGDAFNGGFAFSVSNNFPIEKCLQIGNACGALATTTLGAQNSIGTIADVTAFMEKQGLSI